MEEWEVSSFTHLKQFFLNLTKPQLSIIIIWRLWYSYLSVIQELPFTYGPSATVTNEQNTVLHCPTGLSECLLSSLYYIYLLYVQDRFDISSLYSHGRHNDALCIRKLDIRRSLV